MGMIVFGCCVGSWDKLTRNVVSHVSGRPLLALSGQRSIAVAYNTILDAYAGTELDALILQHDDITITDPDADRKFLAALTPDVMLAGVAGGSARDGLAWWNADPVGHQRTDVVDIDFGTRAGDVDLLEGSVLVFSPYAVKTLRFDTSFGGFHGYDEIAMQAARHGRVVVVDVDTHHHTRMGFKSADSYREWLDADRRFRDKWLP
jgi:hypothetical protein